MKSNYTIQYRCCMTGETMLKGTLRFTQHARQRWTDGEGRAFNRYFSARAMAAKIDPDLRGRLKRGLPVQGILSDKQPTITAGQIVDPRRCVAEPMEVSWSCPRCGQMHKCKLAMAKKHAQLATCTAPKNNAEKRLPPVPVPQRVYIYGRRKNITVEQRIYNLIREAELVSKIPGCRICKNGKLRDPCRLVEAFKLARNEPKLWHDMIHKDEDQRSAAALQQTEESHRVMGRHSMVEASGGTCGGEHM